MPLDARSIVVIGLLVIVIFVLLFAAANLFRKVGPNQALIVYGFRGTRIITGGGPSARSSLGTRPGCR